MNYLTEKELHDVAREVALELIDAEGSDPDYLSVVEVTDDLLVSYFEHKGLKYDSEQYDAIHGNIVSLAQKYINGAVTKVVLPELYIEER